MSQTTSVQICWLQGREESGEDVEWALLCEGCIAPPTKEMRLDVAWAVLFCGLVEFVSSVAMWVLCSNSGMGCGLPVANWVVHRSGPSLLVPLPSHCG